MLAIDVNKDKSENVKYDYEDFPVYIRKSPLSAFPNFAAESHWHDDIELIAVLSGQVQYNVNGEIVELSEGEGIIVNARQLHYGFSESKGECEFICILFRPILLCTARSFEGDYAEQILSSGIPYFHLSPTILWQNKILNYIKDIYDKKDETIAPLYAQGKLCLLWSELLTQITDIDKTKQTDSKLITLKSMMAFIHENYREKITLEDIAKEGCVSKRTCGIIFLEYLNKTPIEFLVDYRLRKSIELMKNTDMTILEISLEVGFSGASYYAETFRKHFGKSPAQYRKCL